MYKYSFSIVLKYNLHKIILIVMKNNYVDHWGKKITHTDNIKYICTHGIKQNAILKKWIDEASLNDLQIKKYLCEHASSVYCNSLSVTSDEQTQKLQPPTESLHVTYYRNQWTVNPDHRWARSELSQDIKEHYDIVYWHYWHFYHNYKAEVLLWKFTWGMAIP